MPQGFGYSRIGNCKMPGELNPGLLQEDSLLTTEWSPANDL